MFERDLDSKTKARCCLTRQTEEPQATAGLPLHHDPLARITGRVGDPRAINAHAAILNRATASQPSQTRHALLRLQRQYGNRYVQRVVDLARQGEGNAEVSPEVEQAIQQALGRGQTLDSRVRTQMESALGADFSGVRVHTDAKADGLNRTLNARAFTTGQDIFFRQGEYNPGGSGGRKLLAHELTHVVQQNTGSVQRRLIVGSAGDKYEREADGVAEQVTRIQGSKGLSHPQVGTPVLCPRLALSQQGKTLQRQPEMNVEEVGALEINVPAPTEESERYFAGLEREGTRVVTKALEDYMEAMEQGHRQAYANFRKWFHDYRLAREMSTNALIKSLGQWLFGKAINFVFPGSGMFISGLKTAMQAAFNNFSDTLSLARNAKNPPDAFLDGLWATSENVITSLADYPDSFKQEHASTFDAAVIDYIVDVHTGWRPSEGNNRDVLSPGAQQVLLEAGWQPRNSATITTLAERWLTAHIRGVLDRDRMVLRGAGPVSTQQMAEIASLRQLNAVGNRERIYELERRLPFFYRSVVNINRDSRWAIEHKLGISRTQAQRIVEARPHSQPEDIQAIVGGSKFREIQHLVVA